MKKFSLLIVLSILFLGLFLACPNKKSLPARKIKQTLPEKVHVEYDDSVRFAKDGDLIYARSFCYYTYGADVIIKENLKNPAITTSTDKQTWEQYFITSRWIENDGTWKFATEISEDSNEQYHENDHNHQVLSGFVDSRYGVDTSGYMCRGYIDVNSLSSSSSTRELANKVITIDGEDVACRVFEYVFEFGDTYSKSIYYYAKNSGIFLKSYTVYEKDAEITEDNLDSIKATHYKEGVSLQTILTRYNLGTIPDFSAFV